MRKLILLLIYFIPGISLAQVVNRSPSTWVSLGPTPGTFNGATSSRVRAVRYDPDNPQIVYIGTADGGVWKSTDGGNSWTPKTDNEASLSSGALTAYNSNNGEHIIYYGTGEGSFGHIYLYYGQGLLKSTDGGDSWKQILNGLPAPSYFFEIAINPASPNVLLAALGTGYTNPVNSGGLYRSEDYGETWIRIIPASLSEDGLTCNDVLFSPDGSRAYAIGPNHTGSPNWWENGIGYRISYDGGATFQSAGSQFPAAGYMAVSHSNPNVMYALIDGGCSNSPTLYRSGDAGATWQAKNSNFASSQCGYNMMVKVHPSNEDIVFAGAVYLYKSTNGGDYIEYLGNTHNDYHDLAFNPQNPDEILVANDGGVWKSTDGGREFQNLNNTLTALELYSVASDPGQDYHMIAGAQDNGLQERPDNNPPDNAWHCSYCGFDVTTVLFDADNPNHALANMSAHPTGIHFSTDRGGSWSPAAGLPAGGYAWIRPIIPHPGQTGKYYTANMQNIYVSNDYGQNWSALGNAGINEKIEELAVSESSPDILFAATGPFEYMPDAYPHKLYKSTDAGLTWSDITGNALPNKYISSINIEPNNSNSIIVTYAGFGTRHVFKSTDGGNNWMQLDCGSGGACLPDVPVNDLVIYGTNSKNRHYIIATDFGVFSSTGNGIWQKLQPGLPNCVIMDLEIHGTKLRAASYGRGVWQWDLEVRF